MKQQAADVIIIGAGLTGLVTAFYLVKGGKKVVLLEKNDRPGGVIQTAQKNGFVYEKGPNTGVLGTPEAVELFDDLNDLCTLETANPEAKRRLIWKKDQWEELPGGLVDAISTSLFTKRDKVRILAEPFRKRGNDPYENIASLVKRRLGESYLEYAVNPFISGVYAGDPEYLVTKYALPKLYNLEQEFGSFIVGSIRKKQEPKTMAEKRATREVFSVEGGLGNMIAALVAKIGNDTIFTSLQNLEVKKIDRGYRVFGSVGDELYEFNAPNVVSTVNAKAIQSLFPFISQAYIQDINNLLYAKVIQVILGFKKWSGVDVNAFGGLVPSKEQRDILGVLFTSSFLPNRAPKKGALLSVFMGGMQRPDLIELSDKDLLEVLNAELQVMMKADVNNADFVDILRYPTAIPQYGRSTKERLEAIAHIEAEFPGIILAGNIRDGIGMADRIRQGRNVADQLLS